MMNMQLLNRSGLAAIAAATALLSTPALAQDATPVTSDPAPIVADEPIPAEPTTTQEAVADPLAPAATTSPTTTSSTTTTTTRTARPTRATSAPATRAPAASARTPSPVAAPVAAIPATPDAAPLAADPAMVAPLPEPASVAPAASSDASLLDNDMLPIAGAAGLGLLALAGAGFAMRRRRRDDDEVMVDNEWHEPVISRAAPQPVHSASSVAAPVMASAPIAASPFNWDSLPRHAAAPVNRIEAAKHGPTPDNPSLSLKKRLKRAAFFDQRDRQIAAGKGTPVSSTAGLPDQMARPVAAQAKPTRRPDQTFGMSFGRTFQPA